MSDVRSSIFSELHRTWLKPLGFRKAGRKSIKQLENGLTVVVCLESYPAPPGGPFRFSIDTCAHAGEGSNRIVYTLSLPTHLRKGQYWTVDSSTNAHALEAEVVKLFGDIVIPALPKMQHFEGLVELFDSIPEHIPLFWYYTSYFNCLKRLNMQLEAIAVLERAIASAPHEGVLHKANSLLTEINSSSTQGEV